MSIYHMQTWKYTYIFKITIFVQDQVDDESPEMIKRTIAQRMQKPTIRMNQYLFIFNRTHLDFIFFFSLSLFPNYRKRDSATVSMFFKSQETVASLDCIRSCAALNLKDNGEKGRKKGRKKDDNQDAHEEM